MSPGFVGLYMKGKLRGGFFTIFRNWLPLGRAVPLGLSKPQDVKVSNIENKRWLIHKYSCAVPAHLGLGGRKCRADQACSLMFIPVTPPS